MTTTPSPRAVAEHAWRATLEPAGSGAHDGFFAAGGTSLSALAVVREVVEVLRLDVAAEQRLLRALFDFATREEFAALVERETAPDAAAGG